MPTYTTQASIDKALARLKAQVQELEQRGKILREDATAVENRRALLFAYCKKNHIERSDVMWCYEKLPLMRITRKSRLERIEQRKMPAAHEPDIPRDKKSTNAYAYTKLNYIEPGRKMRELRKAKGMSLDDMAKIAQRHATMISAWERGKWRPSTDVLAKIEKALGQSLGYPPLGSPIVMNSKGRIVKPELVDAGRRLYDLRKSRGLSTRQLGEVVGKNMSMIRMWEAGVYRMKVGDIAKIEKFFGVSLDYPPASKEE